MIYGQLARFVLPLALTMVAFDLSASFVNGGMARMPRAAETLAAYGLAWGLVAFLASTLSQLRQVALVLASGWRARRKIQRFALLCGVLLAGVLALLALSPAGVWLIEEVHELRGGLSAVARQALLWLAPVPVIEGLNRFYSGLLLRARRTEWVSYATMASIGASSAAVLALLAAEFVRQRPIWLPLLATYAGLTADLGVLWWGCRRAGAVLEGDQESELTLVQVGRFFWPLALVMAVQGVSRPLINLFVARRAGGEEALAVLVVVYSVAHVPYGWLNEMRNLPAAFQSQPDSLRQIRRFVGLCGLLSFAVMGGLFWTPLRGYILEEWIGIEGYMAALCRVPLLLFSFFPLAVMCRSYLHGVALLERRTRALAPSGVARIGAIFIFLLVLQQAGWQGATLGVAALLSGFAAEALVVWWGVLGRGGIRERG